MQQPPQAPGEEVVFARLRDLFLKWLRDLLQLLVFEDHVFDRVDACADAILAIACAELDSFQPLVASIIDAVQPADRRERLGAAFQRLVTLNGITFDLSTPSRRVFRRNLKFFLTETRTFMRFR